MENNFTFLIVDDHNMILEGHRSYLASNYPEANILLASTQVEILHVLQKREVDIILLDLILNGDDSRTFLHQIFNLQPTIKILVISSLEDELVVNSLFQNGIHGFVGKSSPTMYIIEGVEAILSGEKFIDPKLEETIKQRQVLKEKSGLKLTDREKEVLKETLAGKKIKEIAESLFISPKTVENHRSSLFVKFEVENVAGLVKKAILLGYVDL
ncbi:MAG: response regulator transcription factor [Brumimicrobium sp.]